MSNELTNKDYIDILTFYKINIPKSKRLIKKHAENIMSDKLCKCIKLFLIKRDLLVGNLNV